MLPVTGVMLQVTVLTVALLTDALNCCVWPGVSVAVVGLMLTETEEVGVAVSVILAVPETVASAELVAVTVTVWLLATELGAL